MLPKKQRLSRSLFTAERHVTLRTPYFAVKIRQNNLPYSRLGVVVSGAAVKNSVKRNFLKRQTKAIFKEASNGPRDFIIIFNGLVKSLSKKNLIIELRKVFK
jgi:ribonuclease P protein component